MKSTFKTRRNVIAGLAITLGGLVAFRKAPAAAMTPSAGEGPFYPTPTMRNPDVDNDLVKVAGLIKEAGGEVMFLKGLVADRDGTPQIGVRVEIWQCDMNGRYMHPGDDRSLSHDQAFQGFGHDITGPDGTYQFRTIKPAIYPGRTPHIHVKVLDRDAELLTTQFYIKNHVANATDSLHRRMTATQKDKVNMVFVEGAEGQQATVNIIL